MNFNLELELDNLIVNVNVEYSLTMAYASSWDCDAEIESREITINEVRDEQSNEVILTLKESKALTVLISDKFDETLDEACYEDYSSQGVAF
jgi:hypothetical protein